MAALLAGAGFMQTSLAAGAHDRLHYQAAGADILAEREVFAPGVAPLPMTLQAEEGGACGMIAAFPASESGKTLTNPQWQIRRGGGAFEDVAGADNCALRLPDNAADGGDAYIRIRFDEKAGRAIVGVRYGPATALSDLFGERLAKGDSDSSAVVSTISTSDSAQQLTLQNDSAVSDSADSDSPPPVLELEKAEEVVADSVAADSAVSDSDSSSAKVSTSSADTDSPSPVLESEKEAEVAEPAEIVKPSEELKTEDSVVSDSSSLPIVESEQAGVSDSAAADVALETADTEPAVSDSDVSEAAEVLEQAEIIEPSDNVEKAAALDSNFNLSPPISLPVSANELLPPSDSDFAVDLNAEAEDKAPTVSDSPVSAALSEESDLPKAAVPSPSIASVYADEFEPPMHKPRLLLSPPITNRKHPYFAAAHSKTDNGGGDDSNSNMESDAESKTDSGFNSASGENQLNDATAEAMLRAVEAVAESWSQPVHLTLPSVMISEESPSFVSPVSPSVSVIATVNFLPPPADLESLLSPAYSPDKLAAVRAAAERDLRKLSARIAADFSKSSRTPNPSPPVPQRAPPIAPSVPLAVVQADDGKAAAPRQSAPDRLAAVVAVQNTWAEITRFTLPTTAVDTPPTGELKPDYHGLARLDTSLAFAAEYGFVPAAAVNVGPIGEGRLTVFTGEIDDANDYFVRNGSLTLKAAAGSFSNFSWHVGTAANAAAIAAATLQYLDVDTALAKRAHAEAGGVLGFRTRHTDSLGFRTTLSLAVPLLSITIGWRSENKAGLAGSLHFSPPLSFLGDYGSGTQLEATLSGIFQPSSNQWYINSDGQNFSRWRERLFVGAGRNRISIAIGRGSRESEEAQWSIYSESRGGRFPPPGDVADGWRTPPRLYYYVRIVNSLYYSGRRSGSKLAVSPLMTHQDTKTEATIALLGRRDAGNRRLLVASITARDFNGEVTLAAGHWEAGKGTAFADPITIVPPMTIRSGRHAGVSAVATAYLVTALSFADGREHARFVGVFRDRLGGETTITSSPLEFFGKPTLRISYLPPGAAAGARVELYKRATPGGNAMATLYAFLDGDFFDPIDGSALTLSSPEWLDENDNVIGAGGTYLLSDEEAWRRARLDSGGVRPSLRARAAYSAGGRNASVSAAFAPLVLRVADDAGAAAFHPPARGLVDFNADQSGHLSLTLHAAAAGGGVSDNARWTAYRGGGRIAMRTLQPGAEGVSSDGAMLEFRRGHFAEVYAGDAFPPPASSPPTTLGWDGGPAYRAWADATHDNGDLVRLYSRFYVHRDTPATDATPTVSAVAKITAAADGLSVLDVPLLSASLSPKDANGEVTVIYEWHAGRAGEGGVLQNAITVGGNHFYYKITSENIGGRRHARAAAIVRDRFGGETRTTSTIIPLHVPPTGILRLSYAAQDGDRVQLGFGGFDSIYTREVSLRHPRSGAAVDIVRRSWYLGDTPAAGEPTEFELRHADAVRLLKEGKKVQLRAAYQSIFGERQTLTAAMSPILLSLASGQKSFVDYAPGTTRHVSAVMTMQLLGDADSVIVGEHSWRSNAHGLSGLSRIPSVSGATLAFDFAHFQPLYARGRFPQPGVLGGWHDSPFYTGRLSGRYAGGEFSIAGAIRTHVDQPTRAALSIVAGSGALTLQGVAEAHDPNGEVSAVSRQWQAGRGVAFSDPVDLPSSGDVYNVNIADFRGRDHVRARAVFRDRLGGETTLSAPPFSLNSVYLTGEFYLSYMHPGFHIPQTSGQAFVVGATGGDIRIFFRENNVRHRANGERAQFTSRRWFAGGREIPGFSFSGCGNNPGCYTQLPHADILSLHKNNQSLEARAVYETPGGLTLTATVSFRPPAAVLRGPSSYIDHAPGGVAHITGVYTIDFVGEQSRVSAIHSRGVRTNRDGRTESNIAANVRDDFSFVFNFNDYFGEVYNRDGDFPPPPGQHGGWDSAPFMMPQVYATYDGFTVFFRGEKIIHRDKPPTNASMTLALSGRELSAGLIPGASDPNGPIKILHRWQIARDIGFSQRATTLHRNDSANNRVAISTRVYAIDIDDFRDGEQLYARARGILRDRLGGEVTISSPPLKLTEPTEGDLAMGVVGGVMRAGATATVLTAGVTDADGGGFSQFVYYRGGVSVVSSSDNFYVLRSEDLMTLRAGGGIVVTGVFVDGGFGFEARRAATLTMSAGGDSPFSGEVKIDGANSFAAGEVYTANIANPRDENGLGNYAYQWHAGANGAYVPIASATLPHYTLALADFNNPTDGRASLRAVAVHTDLAGFKATIFGEKIHADKKAEGLTITLQGDAIVGAVVAAQDNSFSDANGIADTMYAWRAGTGRGFASPSAVGGDDSKYTIAAADFSPHDRTRLIAMVGDVFGGKTTLTSAPVLINMPTEGRLTISMLGNVIRAGATATVLTAGVRDENGGGFVSFSYHRGGDAIAGASGDSYILTDMDFMTLSGGGSLFVSAVFEDGLGFRATASPAPLVVGSAIDAVFSGDVRIVGADSFSEGGVYVAEVVNAKDANGLGGYTYAWSAGADGAYAAVASSNSPRYTLALSDFVNPSDGNASLRVSVIHTDLAGFKATIVGEKIHADEKAGGLMITLSSPPRAGAIVSVRDASVSDINGIAATLNYQWQAAADNAFASPADIGDDSNYIIAAADFSPNDRARLIAEIADSFGGKTTLTSAPLIINAPFIGGLAIAIVGDVVRAGATATVLTANVQDGNGGGFESFSYSRGDNAIAGASGDSYIFAPRDLAAFRAGDWFNVSAVFLDGLGFRTTLSSSFSPLAAIERRRGDAFFSANVNVAGADSFAEGEVYAVNIVNAQDDNGLGDYSYEWQAGAGGVYVPIASATSPRYTLAVDDFKNPSDGRVSLRAMVIHTDLAGYQATVAAAKMHADTKAKGLTIGLAGGNFFPTPAAIILPNDASVSDINGIAATVSYEWQSGEGLSFANPEVIGSGDRYPIAAVDFVPNDMVRLAAVVEDVFGGRTTLTSAPFLINRPTEGNFAVRIVGGVIRAGAHAVAASGLQDPNGISVQGPTEWSLGGASLQGVSHSPGASFYTLRPQDAEALGRGEMLEVSVNVIDGLGFSSQFTTRLNLVDRPASGAARIAGDPVFAPGKIYEADVSGIADEDGAATFAYQWGRQDGGFSPIVGATLAAYAMSRADISNLTGLLLRVRLTDALGFTTPFMATLRGANAKTEGEVLLSLSGYDFGGDGGKVSASARLSDGNGTPLVRNWRWQTGAGAAFASPRDTAESSKEYALSAKDFNPGGKPCWKSKTKCRDFLRAVAIAADPFGVETLITSRAILINRPPSGTVMIHPVGGGAMEVGATVEADWSGVRDDNGRLSLVSGRWMSGRGRTLSAQSLYVIRLEDMAEGALIYRAEVSDPAGFMAAMESTASLSGDITPSRAKSLLAGLDLAAADSVAGAIRRHLDRRIASGGVWLNDEFLADSADLSRALSAGGDGEKSFGLKKGAIEFTSGDGWSVWSEGSRTKISGSPKAGEERLGYRGHEELFLAGADRRFGDSVFGIAAGRDIADVAVDWDGDNSYEGRARRDMELVAPYAEWRSAGGLLMRAEAGFGDGKLVLESGGDTARADVSWRMLGLNASHRSTLDSGWDWTISGGGRAAQTRVEDGTYQSGRPFKGFGGSGVGELFLSSEAGYALLLEADGYFRPYARFRWRSQFGARPNTGVIYDAAGGLLMSLPLYGLSWRLEGEKQITDAPIELKRRLSGHIDADIGGGSVLSLSALLDGDVWGHRATWTLRRSWGLNTLGLTIHIARRPNRPLTYGAAMRVDF